MIHLEIQSSEADAWHPPPRLIDSSQNLVVNGICDFDVHHKQLFATLLVLHLFLLFLLCELILDDEGYE